nr:hypothetical protein [Tanacetum cinerariifolium]
MKNYPTPSSFLLFAVCALYKARVGGLCWGRWERVVGLMGEWLSGRKSGGEGA